MVRLTKMGPGGHTTFEMPDDLRYQAVYYMNGPAPSSRGVFAIKDPPNAGWSFAFVVGQADAKRVTLFCPFTLKSYKVPSTAAELVDREPVRMSTGRKDWLAINIEQNCHEYARLGLQVDYETAALVLKKLGADAPTAVKAEAVAKRAPGAVAQKERRGGKPHADSLLKPVPRLSKRGQVAEFFLGPQSRSVAECMAKTGMNRNGVLSNLHVLNKTHGLGYEVSKDSARVDVPEGWDIWSNE